MRLSFKRVALGILSVYFMVTCYTGYLLIRKKINKTYTDAGQTGNLQGFAGEDESWNPWGEEFVKEGQREPPHFVKPKLVLRGKDAENVVDTADTRWQDQSPNTTAEYSVEIWGKAAIGLYLWRHIFDAPLETRLGGVWSYGEVKERNILFRFRTGPGVVPNKVPQETENLVLVLNGREAAKINYAKSWLDTLGSLPRLKNVALVLLGSERCENDWLDSYMTTSRGLVNLVFLVYDSPHIDNQQFYQWPLGVATYRDFPKVDLSSLPVHTRRPYICNFLGTVYPNSSRERLMSIVEKHQLDKWCYFKPRMEWSASESEASRSIYLKALQESDLTLNPVGMNSECYRIYEAMAYGSVPVVEDVMTPGQCGNSALSHNAPLRLLKEHGAPVIFLADWDELPKLIRREQLLSQQDILDRRKNLIRWYKKFKERMKNRFTSIIQEKFFNVLE